MGVLDDSSSDGSDSENSANKKAAPQNPQEASKDQQMAAGRMTPFARMKLEQQQKLEELYQDFCVFAKDWLEPSGCIQKGMVVLYFRSNFGNHKYKYTTAAEDMDIEDAFERWNASEHGPKAEQNEFGLYVGVQINAQHDAKVKEQEALDRRKTQIKLIIADSKRSGVKPPLDVLKEAMELGVIAVPKATLESMKAVGARPRRVSMAAPPQPHPSSSSSSNRDKKKKSHSVSRLGKSLGDLDFQKSERKDRKKSPTRKESSSKKSSSSSRLGKSMGDLRYRASPSPTREKKKSTSSKVSSSSSKRRSSSRLGKSMGDLDYKSDKESSSRKERKHKRSPSKDRKSSSRDKEKKRDKKDKEKSRLHKSMGNLDYKSDKERKSSKDKDRKRDKDKEKEKKSSSRDKDRDKEKKKKSSRRSSVA